MTTEEIADRLLANVGLKDETLSQREIDLCKTAARLLYEQEVLIAELQKDRERVELVEKSGIEVKIRSAFSQKGDGYKWGAYNMVAGESWLGRTWREAVDKAKEAQP